MRKCPQAGNAYHFGCLDTEVNLAAASKQTHFISVELQTGNMGTGVVYVQKLLCPESVRRSLVPDNRIFRPWINLFVFAHLQLSLVQSLEPV